MKISQLSTLEDVKFVIEMVKDLGKGVKEYYIPEYGGPYLVPEDGERKFYHLRFNNGNEGFNVGLLLYFIKSFKTTWPSMLAAEINAKPWFADED